MSTVLPTGVRVRLLAPILRPIESSDLSIVLLPQVDNVLLFPRLHRGY